MRFVLALVVAANPLNQFRSRQRPRRLDDRALPVYPLGFDIVEPRTLAGQKTHQQTTGSRFLGRPVVRFEPTFHDLTAMPTRIIPDHDDRFLALQRHPLG